MLQLYDLAGIYYRAFHALPTTLTGPDGTPVNAVRGSLDILARVITDARPSRGVACLDVDWRPAWRVALVPSYKAHRVAMAEDGPTGSNDGVGTSAAGGAAHTGAGRGVATDTGVALGSAVGAPGGGDVEAAPDELSPQVPVLLDVLRAIGIPLAGAEGCEADDVIGTLASRETADAVEVVSGDRDLFQVVRGAPTPVTVRYIGAGMSKVQVMDAGALRDRYGVDGPGYAAMASLRGDPSDGLPGVAGIGEKTAASLIGRFGTVTTLLDAVADPDSPLSPAVRARITAARDYLLAVDRVVAVRTDAPVRRDPEISDTLPHAPADPHALADLVRRYGIGGSVQRLLRALDPR